jgi:TfoX/Sxy family transcriptional regulator of competence genes
MHSDPWPKAPEELQERFETAVAGIDGLEQRQMFGFPAGFIGGNLTTSLHRESWIVRLPDAQRQERLDVGWAAFEPMPGRPMRGYVALPDEVAADPDQARIWVERAAAYVRTLPPKVPKPKKSKATAT